MKLYIKNMACESCKVVVRDALKKVGATPLHIELGEAEVKGDLSERKIKEFNQAINKVGLELIDDKKGILVEKIKAAIIEYVNHSAEEIPIKLSTYLSRELHLTYTYLSNYFSVMQASTIEQYVILLKVEKIKDMIINTDLSLKEIAYQLHYSSVSHLSSQFKRVTGLSPSHFKQLKENRRVTIQKLLAK